jgi:hypothetical protein
MSNNRLLNEIKSLQQDGIRLEVIDLNHWVVFVSGPENTVRTFIVIVVNERCTRI